MGVGAPAAHGRFRSRPALGSAGRVYFVSRLHRIGALPIGRGGAGAPSRTAGADGNFLGPEATLGASLDQAANPSFMSYEEAEFRFTYHTTLVAIMLLVHRLGRRGGALR